ncbi:hypothetical protein E0504_42040 [Parafrankia sp. BMG5.11]|nr:hypothetical protein E0504_42040 [Parafrankia sp. BMG5.11]
MSSRSNGGAGQVVSLAICPSGDDRRHPSGTGACHVRRRQNPNISRLRAGRPARSVEEFVAERAGLVGRPLGG